MSLPDRVLRGIHLTERTMDRKFCHEIESPRKPSVLFPNISHVHYPEVNKILKGLCTEFNVKYNEVPTFWQSIQSHIRWMRKMGQPELAVAA